MKKTCLLLIPLLLCFSACKITPDNPSNASESSEVESESSSSSLPAHKLATFIFYLDYSHSEEEIYKMKWYIGVPLGECPEEALLTDEDASDTLFPHFLGYSRYSSSNDDSLLWDFATDYAEGQSAVLLYGIWVE